MFSVRDIMVRDLVVVEPEVSVRDAIVVMRERDINSVIVGRDGRIEGIFTSRDLLSGRASNGVEASVADLMTRNPVTIDIDESFNVAAETMNARRIRHLPVTEAGRLVGMVSVRDVMHHRTAHLERVVEEQTGQLATKNEELERRHRAMQYHLELAGRIQRQVLPRALPDFPPFSLAVSYHPLERVSGDGYDLVMLGPDRLGILIADACGHGVPAAFVSVMARTVFQAFGRKAESPSEVLRTMNDQLPCLIDESHFITMCFAEIDRTTYRMSYASGGHPSPLWYRADRNTVESPISRGDVIGVLDEPVFEDTTIQLRPNDTVLFFTDGLVECADAGGEHFGQERAAASVLGTGGETATQVIDDLESALDRHRGACGRGDDVTCIAITMDGAGLPTPR